MKIFSLFSINSIINIISIISSFFLWVFPFALLMRGVLISLKMLNTLAPQTVK